MSCRLLLARSVCLGGRPMQIANRSVAPHVVVRIIFTCGGNIAFKWFHKLTHNHLPNALVIWITNFQEIIVSRTEIGPLGNLYWLANVHRPTCFISLSLFCSLPKSMLILPNAPLHRTLLYLCQREDIDSSWLEGRIRNPCHTRSQCLRMKYSILLCVSYMFVDDIRIEMTAHR